MDLTNEPTAATEAPEDAAARPSSRSGSPAAKRVGPIVAMVAVAWLLKKLFGRSHH